MVRLVCIDVDGTLLGTSGEVLPKVWAAVEEARAHGVRLALSSGRPAFGTARGYASRLDPGGWHVFQNGSSIVHFGTGQSMSTPLPPASVAALVRAARSTGRVLELYTDTEYAVESDAPLARDHADLLGLPFAPRSFESMPGAVIRAQWIDVDQFAPIDADPGLEVGRGTAPGMPRARFTGLTAKGVSKASAVRRVSEAYGVSLHDVMFVGDGDNDLEALRVVGVPIAMGNAEAEVRAVASRIVGHVDEGGLADALALAWSR